MDQLRYINSLSPDEESKQELGQTEECIRSLWPIEHPMTYHRYVNQRTQDRPSKMNWLELGRINPYLSQKTACMHLVSLAIRHARIRALSQVMLFVFLVGPWGCTAQETALPFFVGTYTNGESEGIYRYVLQPDGSLERLGLVAETVNPSYLAKSKSGKFLIAVGETSKQDGQGILRSYQIEGDQLVALSEVRSGGAGPCYVAATKQDYVVTANYGDGTVALCKLDAEGRLTGPLDVQRHTGSGTTDRQKGPHAHYVQSVGDGHDLIAIDLGTNELWFSRIDPASETLVPRAPEKLAMEPGAGPRHMTFHPNGQYAYVLNELNSTVSVLEKDADGIYQLGTSLSTLPATFTERNFCADIHISSDGRFLYASNRGHHSIVIYEVDGADGSLTLQRHESTRGETPRNFALSPDNRFLLVANQRTNNIISFRRSDLNGSLTFVDEIEAPTPVCILFDE